VNINQCLDVEARASIVQDFSFREHIKSCSDFELRRQNYFYTYVIETHSMEMFP